MGCKKEPLSYCRLEKKLVSIFILGLLVSTSLYVTINNVVAGNGSDNITTYSYDGIYLNETTTFMDNDTVVINISVDNRTGDPPGQLYCVRALNINTGEWVNVEVSDNNTNPPWGNNNSPGDRIYWGVFNVSSSESTQNGSQGTVSILQVSDGDVINISEIPSSPFDGDDDIAYILVTINNSGGGGNSPPNQPNNEQPGNNSTGVSINTNISWDCTDPDNDPLTFDVYFGNTTSLLLVESNTTNTSYNPGTLDYNTTYYWYVVARDNHGANTTGPLWHFTTGNGSGGPPGPGGSGNSTISGFVLSQQDSSPVDGAVVEIFDNASGYHNATQTDDTGYYIFTNLSAGTYALVTYKQGIFEPVWNSSVNVPDNDTNLENVTFYVNVSGGGSGWSSIYLDSWQSSISPAYVMNNTEKRLTFIIKMYGPLDARLNNITVYLPNGFRYEGNNGSNLPDTSNFTVINTNNMVRWQKTNALGFFFSEDTRCWFNVSTNASLGPHNFTITICYGSNNSETMTKRVFTTEPYYLYGNVKDSDGQPVEGANASVTVQSFGMDGCTYVGVFSDETDANGTFNITGIPVVVDVSSLNLSGPMGPGAGDEGGLFYMLSAQENSVANPNCAIGISSSLPSVPITEFVRLLQDSEIHLKPAITFRVNVTGKNYVWNETTHSMEETYGSKNFSLMVKDKKLGFPVKEYNTMGGERIFSIPRDRNYSFTIFAEQSFPVSISFDNVFATCEANGSLNQPGVTTSYTAYNGSYLVNVSVNVTSTARRLTGTFNNITNPTEMWVVAYTMESQDMVFEDWAMPYNLGNETGNGTEDHYYLSNCTYSIYLPATSATSYLLLRAYARNATGYYMGSAIITAANQALSTSTVDFDMHPLIQGGVNRLIYSSNVSNYWNTTLVVNTTAVLFRLVDSNGDLLNDENPFVEVKREINGYEYKQMIDGENGVFNISLVEGENITELTIYSQKYAPISTPVRASILNGSENTSTIRCSNGICNITMRPFGEFDPFGEDSPMRFMILESNDTTNVPNPPGLHDSHFNISEFSPFKAILKGNVNLMLMKNTSEGWIYVYYINVDLLASGPPDAAFSTESQDAEGGLAKAWQFGSQGPDIYDYVLIGMPLSDDLVNKTVKVEIPLLYDNEFNVIWNASAGDTIDTIRNNPVLNATYGDYLGTAYEAYLNGTGVVCSTTDSTLSSSLAYKDIINRTIWIKIPHFSGVGPQVTGEEPDPPQNFSATANSTSEIYLTWTKPVKADYTRIQRKTDGYPVNISDGTNVYNGSGTSWLDTSLSEGTTYYYSAWSWNQTDGYWSVNSSASYATTKSTPYQTGVSPADGAANVDPLPDLHVVCRDNDTGDTLTAYWYSNSSGSWILFATNTSITSGTTITQTNSNFSSYNTTCWWSVNLTDGTYWCNQTYRFTTRNQYIPDVPANLTATATSSSSVVLSWTKGNGADTTYIRYKQGSSPPSNRSDGTFLYNGTATSASINGLNSNTQYSFRAWSYNSTDGTWSITNISTNATTESSSSGGNNQQGSSGNQQNQQQQEEEEEQEEQQSSGASSSEDVLDEINETFNVELEKPFYANDSDGDGVVDTFTDPNNQLKLVNKTTIDGNITFLISTDDDEIPEFFWNPISDNITQIAHSTPVSSSLSVDRENETVVIAVSIDKSGWVYIDVVDEYPEYNLTVKTSDGRVIPSDRIWRRDGKIYVLDDPSTEYDFVYNYTILPPTFDPESGTTFTDTSRPTITIIYDENVTIMEATFNDNSITLTTDDHRIFTYTPENNLTNGEYVMEITVKDGNNNTRTDTAIYSISVTTYEQPQEQSSQGVPWIIILVVLAMAVLVVLGLLVKAGVLYFERRRPPKY